MLSSQLEAYRLARPYWEGRLVDRSELLPFYQTNENDKVYFLGAGSAGRVYRIIPASNSSFLVKIYDGRSGSSDFTSDERVYRALASDVNSAKIGIHFPTAFNSREIAGTFVVNFKDVKGYSLASILESEASLELKQKLVDAYNFRQDKLFDVLAEKFFLRERQIDAFTDDAFAEELDFKINDRTVDVYTKQNEFIGTINLSEFNIIVDLETEKMTIIDPQ